MRWMLGKSEKPKATSTQEEAPINAAALERRIPLHMTWFQLVDTHFGPPNQRPSRSCFPQKKRSEAIEVSKTQVDSFADAASRAFKKHQEVVGNPAKCAVGAALNLHRIE